ncbi:hypothetical protein PUR23_16315 [Methylorubrum populi]|uniref:Uncharacterized protein n=1 Tax=Methylorubrum rhodesianum TaxID=29427 RepID=A0ABU9ZJQ6_9HYPH
MQYRHELGAAVFAVSLSLLAPAAAAPISPAIAGMGRDEALVTRVADGCGPGFFRTPYGFCRPFRRFYGPPRFYGRRCFFRPTPFGPRRVCRF